MRGRWGSPLPASLNPSQSVPTTLYYSRTFTSLLHRHIQHQLHLNNLSGTSITCTTRSTYEYDIWVAWVWLYEFGFLTLFHTEICAFHRLYMTWVVRIWGWLTPYIIYMVQYCASKYASHIEIYVIAEPTYAMKWWVYAVHPLTIYSYGL